MNNYNKLILTRVDHNINIILGISSLIAFIAAIILYVADLPIIYAAINFLFAILLFIFLLNAGNIQTSNKVILLVLTTYVISIFSFIGDGFSSAFLILLILANIVAVELLEHKYSIIISLASIGLMIGLAIYSLLITIDKPIKDLLLTWNLQIVSFILLIISLHILVYSIKQYLIDTIDELNKLAYYDELTGLANKQKFAIEVQEIINRNQCDGYILLLNLKSLGLINSTLGNTVGDQALLEIAESFNRLKSKNLSLARVGGNEFAIWIDNLSETALTLKFSEIINELKQKSSLAKKKLEFYAAYSKFEENVDSFDACYQRAALILAYAKDHNIIKLLAYNDQLETDLRRKETIKDIIEQGLKDQEFSLHYQVQYDTNTNQVIGVEGLARWQSKVLNAVAPSEFIPIIESMDMSIDFGNFVIDRACRDYKALQEKYNENIHLSLNISPSHIINATIIDTLTSAFEKYQVSANKLVLEITEEIIIKEIEAVKPVLKALRTMGVKISLDDFGSGYSSLNYLTQLELDAIKIDKSFIDQIEDNTKMPLLINNIINLSKQFDLNVIAEGVETQKQRDEIVRLGCHIIQGYYYAKPEPLVLPTDV